MENLHTMANTKSIADARHDFPLLNRQVNGHKLIYLDNGATSQKPRSVIDCISNYYSEYNSNIHRGVHTLSQLATEQYELSRSKVKRFINAGSLSEIIFTKGTTDAINLVASSAGRLLLNEGDEVVITAMEHHSNIVPWQMICQERKAKLRVVPFNDDGDLQMDDYHNLLNSRTKIVACVHVSNSLGTINPVKEIIEAAHRAGAVVLLDGAQAVPHMKVDVQELDVDFYCFSGHKMFAATGIGVLYGKTALLDAMPPYQGGGDMIKTVTLEHTVYNELPFKFEAGTPNIEGGISMGAAIDYIDSVGYGAIQKHEDELLTYATQKLKSIPGLRVVGEARKKAGVLSFLVGNIHPFDMGTILDKLGIAVRTGHHCTQPIMDRFCIPGTARASFALYNNKEDVDALYSAVLKATQMLG